MTSPQDAPFHGWLAHSPSAVDGALTWGAFTPKPFTPLDIDIRITHSSIDGTDLHILRSGWGPVDYPLVAGHEFVGVITRLGSDVDLSLDLHLGDRVGVGSQSGSCLLPTCRACSQDMEQHCSERIYTYNGRWVDGGKTHGGFAESWRGDARFAIKIPDAVPSAVAAPMMVAGVTVCAPMRRYGVGANSRVGIVGIGGLGHLAILFAKKAFGAERVLAISRTRAKEEDVLELGADGIVATGEESWELEHAASLDLIICTASSGKMPLDKYLSLLRVGGVFVQVGGPEDTLPGVNAHQIALNRLTITGGYIGSRKEIRETLNLVAERQIRPWIQERPMKDINQALIDFQAGKPRYRTVLHN